MPGRDIATMADFHSAVHNRIVKTNGGAMLVADGKATAVLSEEHQQILKLARGLSAMSDDLEKGIMVEESSLLEALLFIRLFVHECHQVKEEKWLFPMLEAKGAAAFACPLSALRSEHNQIVSLTARLADYSDAYASGPHAAVGDLIRALRLLSAALRDHISKEDRLMLPLAEQLLSPQDEAALQTAFEAIDDNVREAAYKGPSDWWAGVEDANMRSVTCGIFRPE